MSTDTISPSPAESRTIYIERVNAVIDYIEHHLADDLSLSTLADVAHFSPYHFHRVFSTLVGETKASSGTSESRGPRLWM